MSVINTMLRDLDRRHAPAPLLARAGLAPAENNRRWPRPALALCALLVIVGWSWNRHSTPPETATTPAAALLAAPAVAPAPATVPPADLSARPAAPAQNNEALAKPAPTPAAASASSSTVSPAKAAAITLTAPARAALNVAPESPAAASPAGAAPAEIQANSPAPVQESAATLVKQARSDPAALVTEHYQAARTALAQGQVERAYDLLIDNPPALADATDYHAVLAAVEQQLGRYTDAASRYRQLLQRDGNQSSWWLGLALSLDGGGHRVEAKAGFERALALNTLPHAARDYAAGRAAALERGAVYPEESTRGR